MSLEYAARQHDGIGHRPDTRAVVGAVVAAVGAAVVVLFGGPVSWLAATSTVLNATGSGLMVGNAFRPNRRAIQGHITGGARSVFIGPQRPRAAIAHPITTVDCHSAFVAQGSDSVFVEREPSSRKGDKTSCGGTIDEGLEAVLIGGAPTTVGGVDVGTDRNSRLYQGVSALSTFGGPLSSLARAAPRAGALLGRGESIWRRTATQGWHQNEGPAASLAIFDMVTGGMRAGGVTGGLTAGIIGNSAGTIRKGLKVGRSASDAADLAVRRAGTGVRITDWVSQQAAWLGGAR